MSEADSGMGSESDKDEFMESDQEEIESLKISAQQDKPLSSQPRTDQIHELPHLLKRAHLIPMDSHNLI